MGKGLYKMKTSKSNKKSSKPTAAEIKNARRREAARIKKSNTEFAKLTPAQRRVVIAQDVLSQLESGAMEAEEGVWAVFKKNIPNTPEVELQDFLNNQNSCNACGLGSLFVCAVKRFNHLKIGSVIENAVTDTRNDVCLGDPLIRNNVTVTTTLSYLRGFFSNDQLQAIENAFEQGGGWFDVNGVESKQNNAAKEYFADLENDLNDVGNDFTAELKLKLIMQNIIKNKGTFKTDEKNKPKMVVSVILPGFYPEF